MAGIAEPRIEQTRGTSRPKDWLYAACCWLAGSVAESSLLWSILGVSTVAVLLRLVGLGGTTAEMDEAQYIYAGNMLLRGDLSWQPLNWLGGSYLFPYLTALANEAGGLIGSRLLNVGFGLATIVAVFLFARELFGRSVAVAAAAIYAMMGPAVFVSRLATYDAPAALFFAVALYLLARSRLVEGRWIAPAFVSLAVAFLFKYIILVFVLPLSVFVIVALWRRRGPRAALLFVLPGALLVFAYLCYYASFILNLIDQQFLGAHLESGRAPIRYLFHVTFNYLQVPFTALIVVFLLRPAALKRAKLLLPLALLIPLFHFVTGDPVALPKHLNLTLITIAPLLGLLVVVVGQDVIKGMPAPLKLLLPTICFSLLLWQTWSQVYDYEHSRPNLAQAAAFLADNSDASTRILADNGTVYRYYLSPGVPLGNVVDTYWFSYKDQTGEEAYVSATKDVYFDFIVVDYTTKPSLMDRVVQAMGPNYYLRYQTEAETVRGPVMVSVFERTE